MTYKAYVEKDFISIGVLIDVVKENHKSLSKLAGFFKEQNRKVPEPVYVIVRNTGVDVSKACSDMRDRLIHLGCTGYCTTPGSVDKFVTNIKESNGYPVFMQYVDDMDDSIDSMIFNSDMMIIGENNVDKSEPVMLLKAPDAIDGSTQFSVGVKSWLAQKEKQRAEETSQPTVESGGKAVETDHDKISMNFLDETIREDILNMASDALANGTLNITEADVKYDSPDKPRKEGIIETAGSSLIGVVSGDELIVGCTLLCEYKGYSESSGRVSLYLTPAERYKTYDWNNRYKLAYNGEVFYTGADVKTLLEQAYVEVFHGNPSVNGSMDEIFIKDVLSAIIKIYENFYPLDEDNGPKTNSRTGNIVSLSQRCKLARPFVKVTDHYDSEVRRDVDIYIQRNRVDPEVNSALFYKTTIKVEISNDAAVTRTFHHHLDNTPYNGDMSKVYLITDMVKLVIELYKLKSR